MKPCAIKKCSRKLCSKTYYKFPSFATDLNRYYQWLETTGNNRFLNLSMKKLQKLKICQRHFAKRHINPNGSLKANAIPSLFLPDQKLEITIGFDTRIREKMLEDQQKSPKRLKMLIEPILFKNILPWKMKNYNLEDWKRILGTTELDFRCGRNEITKQPQWESCCKNFKGQFSEFLEFITNNPDQWLYFDYKHLNQWLVDQKDITKDISWDFLGYPTKSVNDSTIWIGSKGAHTPCHKDTYGYNVVAQIYGKKLWILFPPNEDLDPTRIPYEESSIYSKLNFFSPNLSEFKDSERCRKVILEPGDVLYVPHKWWHYVENLEISISVNMWLPHENDDEERLDESLVQFFVSHITSNLSDQIKKEILNPNSTEISEGTFKNSFDLIQTCLNRCQIKNGEKNQFKPELNIEKYNDFIKSIPVLSSSEFYNLLESQLKRFNGKCADIKEINNFDNLTKFINALTNSDVISLIQDKLLKE